MFAVTMAKVTTGTTGTNVTRYRGGSSPPAMRRQGEAQKGNEASREAHVASVSGEILFVSNNRMNPLPIADVHVSRQLVVMSDDNKQSAEDQWQDESMATVHQFGLSLKALHQTNPWPNLPLLPRAMNHLMTELWDNGFSQTEIRQAFEDAVADMPRYAADEEVRS